MILGYIYLLQSSDGLYKIGATKNNPQDRTKKLNTGNGNKIELIYYFQCEQYFKVEKSLHKKYKRQKTETNNEWFELTQEQVNSFLIDCKSLCDNLNFIYEQNYFLKENAN